MLVLTRKEGESIIIHNNNIKIQILDITPNNVKIGFDCDRCIRILREEIYESVVKQHAMAQNVNIENYEGVKVLWKKTKKA